MSGIPSWTTTVDGQSPRQPTGAWWQEYRPATLPAYCPSGCGEARLSSSLAVCIWIPLFALRSEEQRRRPELSLCPTALLSPEDTRRIWQVSQVARRAGVRGGMTVGQAVGLCPSIKLCKPDPVYYDEQFSNLLAALIKVSPIIEPAELGRVFLGVDGLEKLYGPPEKQVAAIRGALDHGTTYRPTALPPYRLGWARGKFIAWVAATRAKPGEAVLIPDAERTDFLATQPIGVLPIDPSTHRRLRQLGITTLCDFARLPQGAVVSQFGSYGRRLWLMACGADTDPVVGRETPEPIITAIGFPTPATDRTTLEHALDRLVVKALRHPQRTGWRVLQVRVRAQQEHGASWVTRVTLKNPTAELDHITAPLKVRLEQLALNGAVETLAVEFTDFARGTDDLQLFARDAASSARAGRQRALRQAVREIRSRCRSSLYHVIEMHPQSRIPERRYALIDYEP